MNCVWTGLECDCEVPHPVCVREQSKAVDTASYQDPEGSSPCPSDSSNATLRSSGAPSIEWTFEDIQCWREMMDRHKDNRDKIVAITNPDEWALPSLHVEQGRLDVTVPATLMKRLLALAAYGFYTAQIEIRHPQWSQAALLNEYASRGASKGLALDDGNEGKERSEKRTAMICGGPTWPSIKDLEKSGSAIVGGGEDAGVGQLTKTSLETALKEEQAKTVKLVEMLKKLQWFQARKSVLISKAICPICEAQGDPSQMGESRGYQHRPDCELAALLKNTGEQS